MSDNKQRSIQDALVKKILMSPELKAVQDFMPIDDTDRERLKKDIELNGIREPLKVYRNPKGKGFYLLAGLNRLEIAKELKLETVPVEILNDLAPKKRKDFCIDDNLNRRQLTENQKLILLAKRYPEYFESPKTKPVKKADTVSAKLVDIAKETKRSNRQLRRDKVIYQKALETKKGDTVSLKDIDTARQSENEKRRQSTTPPASKTARTKTDKNGHREPASNQNEPMQIGRALACIDFALDLCNGKATKETLESIKKQLEKARQYLS